jgi:hypothetical protein
MYRCLVKQEMHPSEERIERLKRSIHTHANSRAQALHIMMLLCIQINCTLFTIKNATKKIYNFSTKVEMMRKMAEGEKK